MNEPNDLEPKPGHRNAGQGGASEAISCSRQLVVPATEALADERVGTELFAGPGKAVPSVEHDHADRESQHTVNQTMADRLDATRCGEHADQWPSDVEDPLCQGSCRLLFAAAA